MNRRTFRSLFFHHRIFLPILCTPSCMTKGMEATRREWFTSLFQTFDFVLPLSNHPNYVPDLKLSTFNDVSSHRFLYGTVVPVRMWGGYASLYVVRTSPHKRSLSLKTASRRTCVISSVCCDHILILNLGVNSSEGESELQKVLLLSATCCYVVHEFNKVYAY